MSPPRLTVVIARRFGHFPVTRYCFAASFRRHPTPIRVSGTCAREEGLRTLTSPRREASLFKLGRSLGAPAHFLWAIRRWGPTGVPTVNNSIPWSHGPDDYEALFAAGRTYFHSGGHPASSVDRETAIVQTISACSDRGIRVDRVTRAAADPGRAPGLFANAAGCAAARLRMASAGDEGQPSTPALTAPRSTQASIRLMRFLRPIKGGWQIPSGHHRAATPAGRYARRRRGSGGGECRHPCGNRLAVCLPDPDRR
jgi:hypothetical protein